MKLSLSKFFPKGTEYFYSFPAGQASNFFNNDPAWKEELITARPLTCAGPDVKVLSFAETLKEPAWSMLKNDMHATLVETNQIKMLPTTINANVVGRQRNVMVKKALREIVTPGTLVMAQPFLDPELKSLFQIEPELSVWFNDKKNMPVYIPEDRLPERYANFADGKVFFESTQDIPFPCVVKVSSSASGDGVRICKTLADLNKAKKEFARIRGTIIVEKYIHIAHNIGVQFGIPWDKSQPIEIIGMNEQLTTPEGEYLGAIIDLQQELPETKAIYQVMLDTILPQVRAKGWYGVGDLDVLIQEDGEFYFIDSNFRMTAMTSYLYQVKNGDIKSSIATFTGTFPDSETDFRSKVLPIAQHGPEQQLIHIMTLTSHKDGYHFNAGMLFNDRQEIAQRAKALLQRGVQSAVLKRLQRHLTPKKSLSYVR